MLKKLWKTEYFARSADFLGGGASQRLRSDAASATRPAGRETAPHGISAHARALLCWRRHTNAERDCTKRPFCLTVRRRRAARRARMRKPCAEPKTKSAVNHTKRPFCERKRLVARSIAPPTPRACGATPERQRVGREAQCEGRATAHRADAAPQRAPEASEASFKREHCELRSLDRQLGQCEQFDGIGFGFLLLDI